MLPYGCKLKTFARVGRSYREALYSPCTLAPSEALVYGFAYGFACPRLRYLFAGRSGSDIACLGLLQCSHLPRLPPLRSARAWCSVARSTR